MSKTQTKGAAPKQPTEEERRAQAMRAYYQKKASIAEGTLFNLASSGQISDNVQEVVRYCDNLATEFMRVIYRQEVKVEEPDAEE